MKDIQAFFNENRGMRIKIAKALGITHGAVSQWTQVPLKRLIEVERITGISRRVLRPDISHVFPPEVGSEAPREGEAA